MLMSHVALRKMEEQRVRRSGVISCALPTGPTPYMILVSGLSEL